MPKSLWHYISGNIRPRISGAFDAARAAALRVRAAFRQPRFWVTVQEELVNRLLRDARTRRRRNTGSEADTMR